VDTDFYEDALAEISRLTPDDIASVMSDIHAVLAASVEDETIQNEDAGTELLPVFLRIYMLAFLQGQAVAQAADVDVLVPITPEQAASINAGLFGSGTTIVLSVVRDN
jgi:hypothetical protein